MRQAGVWGGECQREAQPSVAGVCTLADVQQCSGKGPEAGRWLRPWRKGPGRRDHRVEELRGTWVSCGERSHSR